MAKRPRDPNQLAKLIVDIAAGEEVDTVSDTKQTSNCKDRPGGLKSERRELEGFPQEIVLK